MKLVTVVSVLFIMVSVLLVGCSNEEIISTVDEEEQLTENTDNEDLPISEEERVVSVVERFGQRLQQVSLQAPESVLEKSIEENYGELVSPSLLARWLKNPQSAPGRLVSSPWPERIDILSMEQISVDTYQVRGEVIEITSVEKTSGGIAAKYPITLMVKKTDGRWVINDVEVIKEETDHDIIYKNTNYGFTFRLPQSWEGFRIVADNWEGVKVNDDTGKMETAETGPLLLIRHPEWSREHQRQDIPIMIFTIHQWELMQQGAFHIGAGPVGPREIGRNKNYVFAIPARYHFAFPPGHEEVQQLIESNAFQPIDLD
ncbi:MAG: hypothetical protein H0Z33_03290 [Bacillaceae bacterium]|nr:hypothetical protein [Bacillaceae bacterium]